jgi:hypothetical protein
MGSAFVAVADDPSGIYYNPAGLTQVRSPGVGFAWRAMPLLDRKQGYFQASIPLREEATIGFAWVHSGVGDIVERSSTGAAGETFGFSENYLTLAFAKRFGRVISVGGGVDFVHQSLFEVSGNTLGLSAGIHTRFDDAKRRPYPDVLQRLTLGAALQYMGMSMRFDSHDYYQPRNLGNGTVTNEEYPVVGRVGAAYRFLRNRSLLVSADATYVEDQHLRGYFGAEWRPDPRLLLRGGLAEAHPTFGVGLLLKWGKTLIGVDYALVTSPANADADHIFAIGVGL